MCTSTKPTSMMPLIAMAYFFPTAVPYRSSRKNLRRFFVVTAVPVTGPRDWIACAIA